MDVKSVTMKPLKNSYRQQELSAQNAFCQKCPKHFGAKRNMLKHMATGHKYDTKVKENCKTTVSVNIDNLDLPSVNVRPLLAIPEDPLPNDPLEY